jgi:hypothetical protein
MGNIAEDVAAEVVEVPKEHVVSLLGHGLNAMSYGVYSARVPYEALKLAVECLDW